MKCQGQTSVRAPLHSTIRWRMRCPHCNAQVGFFSRAMSRWGRVKACPSCGAAVRVGFSPLAIVLGLLGAGVLGWFKSALALPKPWFSIVLGLYVGVLIYVASRLRKAE